MTHWIHPEAEAELEEAALYLAQQASPALAEAFLLEYERVLALLVDNQQSGPHGDHGMRLYHLNRFPYTLVYEEDSLAGPQVYAVAPQARHPGYWLQRI
ncbi:MAG: type II toxin-antitoxin system RelE/ParE family toxin [Burkholderiaceae bacterium]